MSTHEAFSDKTIRQSRYVISYKRGNNVALFHRFKLKKAYGDMSLLRLFDLFRDDVPVSSLSPDEKRNARLLYESGFLVDDEVDYVNRVPELMKKRLLDIYFMFLFTTDRCNFNCKYCYIERRLPETHRFNNLTKKDMQNGVDLFFNYARRSKQNSVMVVLYGGEPLVNKKVALDALDYLEDNKNCLNNYQKLRPNLITNGSLVDDECINKIVSYDVRTAVSIDGPRRIHNSVRMYASGKGTYDDVIRNYYRMKKAGVEHLGVSITVGSHNIDHLKSFCEFVATKLEPRGVKFNFMSPLNKNGNPYACDLKANLDKVTEAFDVFRDYGIFEDTIGRKLEYFIKGLAIQNATPANGSQITLFPNGRIGPCEALLDRRFSVGLAEAKNLDEVQLFREWKEMNALDKPKCLECPAVALCAGGHPADALIKNGSLLREDSNSCSYMPEILEWLIWSYADKAGLA